MVTRTGRRGPSEPTRIGNILARRLDLEEPDPAPQPMTVAERREYLEALTRLPPLKRLRERLAAAEADLQTAREMSPLTAGLQRRVDLARHEVELGEERDQVQSCRPDGCWCLGVGATGWAPQVLTDGYYDPKAPTDVPRRVVIDNYERFCSCDAGQVLLADLRRQLLEAEEADRAKRMRRQWEQSGIPARFIDLRLATHPILQRDAALRLALETADLGASWYFVGPNGIGKTVLATGYGWAWLQRRGGGSIVFRTVPKLLDELRAAFNRRDNPDERPGAVLEDYLAADLLILDDIGQEQVTGWVRERLFLLIGGRHDALKPTVFTSKVSIAALADRLGPDIADRIIEMVAVDHYIELDGPNLRGR